jgi:hypothetical protein
VWRPVLQFMRSRSGLWSWNSLGKLCELLLWVSLRFNFSWSFVKEKNYPTDTAHIQSRCCALGGAIPPWSCEDGVPENIYFIHPWLHEWLGVIILPLHGMYDDVSLSPPTLMHSLGIDIGKVGTSLYIPWSGRMVTPSNSYMDEVNIP